MSKGELSGDACRFPSDAALNRIMTLTQIDNFAEYPRHRQPAKAPDVAFRRKRHRQKHNINNKLI